MSVLAALALALLSFSFVSVPPRLPVGEAAPATSRQEVLRVCL